MTQQYTEQDWEHLREFVLWGVNNFDLFEKSLRPSIINFVNSCSDVGLYNIISNSVSRMDNHKWEELIKKYVEAGNKVPKITNQ